MEAPVSHPDMEAVYILIGCLIVSGLVIISIFCYCTITACSKQLLSRGFGLRRKKLESGNGIPHSDTSEKCSLEKKKKKKLIRWVR